MQTETTPVIPEYEAMLDRTIEEGKALLERDNVPIDERFHKAVQELKDDNIDPEVFMAKVIVILKG